MRGDRLADDHGRRVPASSVCLTASALLGTACSTAPPISSEHGNELAFLEAGACTHEGDEVSCGQGTPAGLGGVEEFERHCDPRKASLESRSARQVCLSLIDVARIRWVCPGWRDQVVR